MGRVFFTVAVLAVVGSSCASRQPSEPSSTSGSSEVEAGQDAALPDLDTESLFSTVILDQGWMCDIGIDNCWRRLEVHSNGTFVAADSEGEETFELSDDQLESVAAIVATDALQDALLDEEGVHCGSFFGDGIFFTVKWSDGTTQRASAAGCVDTEGHVYDDLARAFSQLRRDFIECVDQTAPDYEDLDAVREGRIRGLCVPCGGTC